MKVIINETIIIEVSNDTFHIIESIKNVTRTYVNGEYIYEISKDEVDIKFIKNILDSDSEVDAINLLSIERDKMVQKEKELSARKLKIEQLEAFEKYRINKGYSHKEIKDAINSFEYSFYFDTWEKVKEKIQQKKG